MNILKIDLIPYMFNIFDYMSLNTLLIGAGIIMIIGALASMANPSIGNSDDAELGLFLFIGGIATTAMGLGYLNPLKEKIIELFFGA